MSGSLALRYDSGPTSAASTSTSSAGAAIFPFPIERRRYDAGPREPWQVDAIRLVATLTQLEPNWDGYGAPRVNLDTGMFVLRILNDIMLLQTRPPQIVPSSVGGIQVEWHTGGIDLELHITSPYQGELWFEDHHTGATESGEISEDITQIQRLVRVLSSR